MDDGSGVGIMRESVDDAGLPSDTAYTGVVSGVFRLHQGHGTLAEQVASDDPYHHSQHILCLLMSEVNTSQVKQVCFVGSPSLWIFAWHAPNEMQGSSYRTVWLQGDGQGIPTQSLQSLFETISVRYSVNQMAEFLVGACEVAVANRKSMLRMMASEVRAAV